MNSIQTFRWLFGASANFNINLNVINAAPKLHKCCQVLKYSSNSNWNPPASNFNADVEGEHYKTTVSLDNFKPDTGYLYIDSYSTFGFKLSNGFRVMGPLAIFPKTCLHWNVTGAEDIHMHSLSLFTVLEPKIDLLIIGVGEPSEIKYVNKELYRDLKSKGIGLELLSTHQACATYNFLNHERRCIAAAFLPPKRILSQNIDEFLLPDNFESVGGFLAETDYNTDPMTGRKLKSDGDDGQEDTNRLSPGYWDDGVPKPSRTKLDRPDRTTPDDPQLPDGKTKT